MGNKMLIDASHPEETRVVVVKGDKVEEFDYESALKKQLRGNIYLARVTRVEPSLQAAFVDYGGNRHGFLAFSEIHPDYYQIPMADRLALLAEEAESESKAEADEDLVAEQAPAAKPVSDDDDDDDGFNDEIEELTGQEQVTAARDEDDNDDEDGDNDKTAALRQETADSVKSDPADATAPEENTEPETEPVILEGVLLISPDGSTSTIQSSSAGTSRQRRSSNRRGRDHRGRYRRTGRPRGRTHRSSSSDSSRAKPEPAIEQVGREDALEEVPARIRAMRKYKIQEVIKRRQVILVQVVKEERGNKGAALTTYLSLAGRFTVLMPNTARGGGISRKITNVTDRKRLRKIARELEVPEGMGLIIRTAGAARTRADIKRDFEYLLRLWESVRELTLQSQAPTLVYEEGNLIKRSIRDLYDKNIDEILISGQAAYQQGKDFMRMLMPSHARNVQQYKGADPLFTRYHVERQLDAMFSPSVTLPSGGYIVINQTEALVAIDINSGKSTREHSIEETALNTNLEAAEEISRQLRLRDLAGLIVIDFIDMEERRNNRTVERRLKDCLHNDRARIQLGRISAFGLLEMSRQRLRTGVLEGSTTECKHCLGTGIVRSTESVALSILRAIEDRLQSVSACDLTIECPVDVAFYILNNKRSFLHNIERRYRIILTIEASKTLFSSQFTIENTVIEPGSEQELRRQLSEVIQMDWSHQQEETGKSRKRTSKAAGSSAAETGDDTDETAGQTEPAPKPRQRRRRKERPEQTAGPDDATDIKAIPIDESPETDKGTTSDEATDDTRQTSESQADNTKPTAGRRRRTGTRRKPAIASTDQTMDTEAQAEDNGSASDGASDGASDKTSDETPKADDNRQRTRRSRSRRKKTTEATDGKADNSAETITDTAPSDQTQAESNTASQPEPLPVTAAKEPQASEPQAAQEAEPAEEAASKASGEDTNMADQQETAALSAEQEEARQRRRAWWQRRFKQG